MENESEIEEKPKTITNNCMKCMTYLLNRYDMNQLLIKVIVIAHCSQSFSYLPKQLHCTVFPFPITISGWHHHLCYMYNNDMILICPMDDG